MVPSPTRPESPIMQRTTLCNLPSRILTARQNVFDTGFCLADEQVLNNVEWVRDGRANRLVVKKANAAGDGVDADAENTSEAGKYPSPPPEEGQDVELASLCAIVRVCNHDYWLTSDANYRVGSQAWRELVNAKPSCTLEQPDPQPVRDDFNRVMANLHELKNMVATPGYQLGKGFIMGGGISGERFKVRHVLFEPLGTAEEEEAVASDVPDDVPEEGPGTEEAKDLAAFTMEKYPLFDDDARDELLSLKETHRIVPIPAYNIQGKLIKPDAYRRTLEEALVEVHFNLSHWSIAGKKGAIGSDVFTADIEMIRVIAPPRATGGSTVRKRKISLYVDPAASPNKKRRVN